MYIRWARNTRNGMPYMPQPPSTLWVVLALVAGCLTGSATRFGCDSNSGGAGPAWPIVDGEAAIPPGTQRVTGRAFYVCHSLASVAIPTSVTSIGNEAFFGCTGLVSVEIPTSVTSIESMAFNGCQSLVSVKIPTSVARIGNYVFNGCLSLESVAWPVAIPTSSLSMGYGTFQHCTSLVSVEIPTSVTSIGKYTFGACSSLVSISIPTSVTSIGVSAFNNARSLVSIDIPASTTIGNLAFDACGCNQSMYVAGSTVCNCAASPTWPCTPQQLPVCAGRAREACTVYYPYGLGMCCNLEARNCICAGVGTATEIADICGELKNDGIDCDHCKASLRCNR